MREFMLVLYQKALRVLNLGERRCAWCRRFLGWRFGLRGQMTHGICGPCKVKFDAESDLELARQRQQRRRKSRRQRTSCRTLRRRTGGWSGAVASGRMEAR